MLILRAGDAEKRLEPVFGIRDDGALLIGSGDGVYCIPGRSGVTVADGRRSALWKRGVDGWAFPEWFIPYFWENLKNGAERERAIVVCYRELLLREFPRADLALPRYSGSGMIRCPRCGRIFEPLSFLGVVRCNGYRCHLEMNNPFYAPERLRESCEWKRLTYYLAGQGGYYHAPTRRYYPAPPTEWDLLRERIVMRWAEWRRRRRLRRWQELRRLCRRYR